MTYQIVDWLMTYIECFVMLVVVTESGGRKFEEKKQAYLLLSFSLFNAILVAVCNQISAFSFITPVLSILETKNPVFTVLKRQRCRNAQEVNDISTPFYTPFRPVVRYSNYQGCFLRLNPGWGQETNIDPDN